MISVIIPTHNRIDDLKKALLSVYYQTVLPSEIIVIDDGSSPEVTNEIFKDAPEKIKTILLRNEIPKGACNARNKGIDIATSEWVAFLDDDDEYLENKLYTIECFLKENNDADIIYHRAIINMVNEEISYLTPYIKQIPHNKFISNLLIKNIIGSTSIVACKRVSLINCGKFDEELKALQDYEIWLRLAKSGYKFKHINMPLVRYYHSTNKNSISKNIQFYKESVLYIEKKYYNEYEKLSKKDKEKYNLRKNEELVHRYLLNGNIKKAYLCQLKYIKQKPSIRSILLLILMPFGLKYIFRILALTRNK